MAAARELVIADEPGAWARLGFAPSGGAIALGGLRVRLAGRGAGEGIVALRVDALARERPDGLPVVAAAEPAGGATAWDRTIAEYPIAVGRTTAAPAHGETALERMTAAPTHGETAAERTTAAPTHGETALERTAAPHPNGALAIDHLVALTDDRDRTMAALAAAGGDLRRRGEPPELPARMAFVRFGELIVEVAEAGGPARFWGLTVTVADLDALAGPLLGEARPAVQPGRRIATVRRAAGLSVALAFMSA